MALPWHVCIHACSVAHSYLTLVTPWTVAQQAPLYMGLSWQEYWNGLPFTLPKVLPDLGIEPVSPTLTGGFFTTEPPGKPWLGIVILNGIMILAAAAAAAKSLQSCPTLCDPIDCSLPSFSVHGILQARTLEWVAISFSNAWKWKAKSVAILQICPSTWDIWHSLWMF